MRRVVSIALLAVATGNVHYLDRDDVRVQSQAALNQAENSVSVYPSRQPTRQMGKKYSGKIRTSTPVR